MWHQDKTEIYSGAITWELYLKLFLSQTDLKQWTMTVWYPEGFYCNNLIVLQHRALSKKTGLNLLLSTVERFHRNHQQLFASLQVIRCAIALNLLTCLGHMRCRWWERFAQARFHCQYLTSWFSKAKQIHTDYCCSNSCRFPAPTQWAKTYCHLKVLIYQVSIPDEVLVPCQAQTSFSI